MSYLHPRRQQEEEYYKQQYSDDNDNEGQYYDNDNDNNEGQYYDNDNDNDEGQYYDEQEPEEAEEMESLEHLIIRTINAGAPLYNNDKILECFELYIDTTKYACKQEQIKQSMVGTLLEQATDEAMAVVIETNDFSHGCWILRQCFDTILSSASSSSPSKLLKQQQQQQQQQDEHKHEEDEQEHEHEHEHEEDEQEEDSTFERRKYILRHESSTLSGNIIDHDTTANTINKNQYYHSFWDNNNNNNNNNTATDEEIGQSLSDIAYVLSTTITPMSHKRYRGTYTNCFQGSEVIEILCSLGVAKNRDMARYNICNLLLEGCYLIPASSRQHHHHLQKNTNNNNNNNNNVTTNTNTTNTIFKDGTQHLYRFGTHNQLHEKLNMIINELDNNNNNNNIPTNGSNNNSILKFALQATLEIPSLSIKSQTEQQQLQKQQSLFIQKQKSIKASEKKARRSSRNLFPSLLGSSAREATVPEDLNNSNNNNNNTSTEFSSSLSKNLITYNGVSTRYLRPHRPSVTSSKETIIGMKLANLCRQIETIVDIKDRKYNFKTYTKCFIAIDAITTVINEKIVPNRLKAVTMFNELLYAGLIHHVTHDHIFKDERLFYRFTTIINIRKAITKIENDINNNNNSIVPPKPKIPSRPNNDEKNDSSNSNSNNSRLRHNTNKNIIHVPKINIPMPNRDKKNGSSSNSDSRRHNNNKYKQQIIEQTALIQRYKQYTSFDISSILNKFFGCNDESGWDVVDLDNWRTNMRRWGFGRRKDQDDDMVSKLAPIVDNIDPKTWDMKFGNNNDWESPYGILAQIAIFDQIPRSAFRGTSKAFHWDQLAINATKCAINKGYFESAYKSTLNQFLLLLPLEHSESWEDQKLGVTLLLQLLSTVSIQDDGFSDIEIVKRLEFSKRLTNAFLEHAQVIAKFKRYPHRNNAHGRKTTLEERIWLASDLVPQWAKSQQQQQQQEQKQNNNNDGRSGNTIKDKLRTLNIIQLPIIPSKRFTRGR